MQRRRCRDRRGEKARAEELDEACEERRGREDRHDGDRQQGLGACRVGRVRLLVAAVCAGGVARRDGVACDRRERGLHCRLACACARSRHRSAQAQEDGGGIDTPMISTRAFDTRNDRGGVETRKQPPDAARFVISAAGNRAR